MKKIVWIVACLLTACSTQQQIDSSESRKQSMIGAVAGGAVGAGAATLTGSPMMAAVVLVPVGAAIGYYIPKINSETQAINAAGGAVYQAGDYVTIVLPADRLFDPGTADYIPGAEAALIHESAEVISDFPDSEVLVTGHTDDVGSALSQAKLSRQQAKRIALSLWESPNIDKKTFQRIEFIGMGNVKPIANSGDVRAQALNRRIQITIYPKKMAAQVDEAVKGSDRWSVP